MSRENPEALPERSVSPENASTILLAREKVESERRDALESLGASEERLRAILHQTAVGMAVAELDGTFIEVNEKFCEIVGYSQEELRGLTFRHLTHPDDLKATEVQMSRVMAGEIRDFLLEKRYVRRDAEVVWASTAVTLLRDVGGKPERFVGVLQDISERKMVEEALAEESRSLELLNRTGVTLGASRLDLAALRLAAIDATMEISGAELAVFQLEVGQLEGKPERLLTVATGSNLTFGEPDQLARAGYFSSALLGGGTVRSDDVWLDSRFQGLPHTGAASAGPGPSFRSFLGVPLVRRGLRGAVGLFFVHSRPGAFTERIERMVTGVAAQAAVAIENAHLYASVSQAADERLKLLESERSARSEAERMSSLKDEFLATLSHELRTPLSAILGWTQVLRRGAHDAADLTKGLETIERNARVQIRLIEELLDMSRVTSGKLRLEVQVIDPAVFVEAALDTVRPAAEAKGIRLGMTVESNAGPITGDPARLQQVVWNLLSNAIKFTERGGAVGLRLRRVDSAVEIVVTDNGTGIAPEFLSLVFERFRQSDASSSRTQGGLGLGLAIVKNLVELHGGTVSAKSAGKGKGAEFSVLLPLSSLQGTAVDAVGSSRRSSQPEPIDFRTINLSGTTVLAVDDDADAREIIRRVLTDCFAEVVTASSAIEAMQLLEGRLPDVMISDIGMPEVDGFELLRRVQRLAELRGEEIPVIALTAFARSEDRARALDAGFRLHLSKPIEPAELVASVANIAARPRGPR
ncbi:MAG: PAS domain S-box protein [Thermoanaerobaculia bacterium]